LIFIVNHCNSYFYLLSNVIGFGLLLLVYYSLDHCYLVYIKLYQ